MGLDRKHKLYDFYAKLYGPFTLWTSENSAVGYRAKLRTNIVFFEKRSA